MECGIFWNAGYFGHDPSISTLMVRTVRKARRWRRRRWWWWSVFLRSFIFSFFFFYRVTAESRVEYKVSSRVESNGGVEARGLDEKASRVLLSLFCFLGWAFAGWRRRWDTKPFHGQDKNNRHPPPTSLSLPRMSLFLAPSRFLSRAFSLAFPADEMKKMLSLFSTLSLSLSLFLSRPLFLREPKLFNISHQLISQFPFKRWQKSVKKINKYWFIMTQNILSSLSSFELNKNPRENFLSAFLYPKNKIKHPFVIIHYPSFFIDPFHVHVHDNALSTLTPT